VHRESNRGEGRTANAGSGTETDRTPRAIMGVQCPAAFEAIRWVGCRNRVLAAIVCCGRGYALSLEAQSIASRVRALAKQSIGRASSTIASSLTTIWIPRLISSFSLPSSLTSAPDIRLSSSDPPPCNRNCSSTPAVFHGGAEESLRYESNSVLGQRAAGFAFHG